MNKALFIGRFQPFHKGHLSVLKQIDDDNEIDEIIIGVGSSQYSNTEDNPYSFEDRKIMIEKSLSDEMKKSWQIIAIPDIHDEKNWVEHVRKIVPEFGVVYTGNEWLERLFTEKNIEIKKIDKNINISGTDLRKMIKEGAEEWKKFIPEKIIDLIK
ncbi:MAG: nicotinamide-nucleotide adenylyltransferase [Patescibacteria group bacterium]